MNIRHAYCSGIACQLHKMRQTCIKLTTYCVEYCAKKDTRMFKKCKAEERYHQSFHADNDDGDSTLIKALIGSIITTSLNSPSYNFLHSHHLLSTIH